MTNEVSEFLKKHDTCEDGLEWAVENCKTLEDVWDTAKPEWFIWLATREGVLPEMDLHRFACRSVRQIWDLLTDERSRYAIEVKERWIEGKATDEELAAAGGAAWVATGAAVLAAPVAAARAAARAAAGYAVRAAARAAAGDAVRAAACDAAWAAARAAAWEDAWDAAGADAWEDAWDAARKKQAQYIRNTFTPNFK